MPDESIGINLSLDMDSGDLDRAIGSMTNKLESQFGDAFNEVEKMIKGLNEAIRPLQEMTTMAKKMSDEFDKIQKATQEMRQNVASTRLQAGGGGIATGSMGSAFGGVPGLGLLGSLLGIGSTGLALGGLALGGGLLARSANQLYGEATGDRRGVFSRAIGFAAEHPGLTRALTPGIAAAEYLTGTDVGDIAGRFQSQAQDPARREQMTRNALMGIGVLRGIGQGPMGMFANISGTARGWEAGQQAAGALFPGSDLARTVGGGLGAIMLPGMIQNYAQEAMSRYPGYLQTAASISSVAMHGGNVRQIMGLRPGRWGYGPGEIGPEFGALYQGFGGNELTSDTLRTSMAYSRRYGIGMGQIGQAIGGLVNVGGGGQFAGGAENEAMMARVMTDAIAAGFGRRLPEYAQAVGASVQSAMQGPALIAHDQAIALSAQMSTATGLVATENRMGLGAAGRLMAPLVSSPQSILEGMFSGRGSPYQMAMYWGTNRGRFGNDPMAMMETLERNASTPFSQEMLEFQRGPLEQIMRSSPNQAIAVQSLRELMPDISFTGARMVTERAQGYMQEHGGTLEGADIAEMFTGVEEAQINEAQETRDTMRDIQRSGERIMNEQLGAMRANAGFAWQQYTISAEMARDAATFHRIQMGMTRVGTQLMRDIGVSSDITAMGNLFSPELIARLGDPSTAGSRAATLMQEMMRHLGRSGVDVDALAEMMGFSSGRENRRVSQAGFGPPRRIADPDLGGGGTGFTGENIRGVLDDPVDPAIVTPLRGTRRPASPRRSPRVVVGQ